LFTLHFTLFNLRIRVDYPSEDITPYLLAGLSGFVSESSHSPSVCYRISGDIDAGFVIEPPEGELSTAASYWELLQCVENHMTRWCVVQRPELYLMHGCMVALNGKAFLISAPSKSGKSTLTWALLNHGFDYISDDISPIDLTTLNALPYPRGISQRTNPDEPYSLPQRALSTGKTFKVSGEALPCQVIKQPTPLAALFFITRNPNADAPLIAPLSASESCMNLFAKGLN